MSEDELDVLKDIRELVALSVVIAADVSGRQGYIEAFPRALAFLNSLNLIAEDD